MSREGTGSANEKMKVSFNRRIYKASGVAGRVTELIFTGESS
jgi:hypothetical protein